jgi:ribosome biogenesis GTPase
VNLALVIRVDLKQAILLTAEGTEVAARLRARLMDRQKRIRGAVVAGDEVEWEEEDAGEHGIVEGVLPRRNYFSRRAARGEAREQIVAANLDEVIVVAALAEPPLHQSLLDRVAVAAHCSGLPLRIALTKLDLVPAGVAEEPASLYRGLGYPVHLLSAPTGEGVREFRSELEGRRTLFIGHSGVGKSTLLNMFEPSLGLRIGEVNPVTGKGRHTTTAALLVRLQDGTEIVDTPGFRSFSPWGASLEDVREAFPELRERLGGCRFRNCSHRTEPDCVILEALESGDIDKRRYLSYSRLIDEIEAEAMR